jgi:putative ATPase
MPKNKEKNQNAPLADLLRPQSLEDIIGQDHLFGETGVLTAIVNSRNVSSMILQGPTGVGKTTIAKALAKVCDANFVAMSAINSGAADIRKVVEEAKKASFEKGGGPQHSEGSEDLFLNHPSSPDGDATLFFKEGKKTILMVDEIHHFNKTQQDLFLPFVEDGTIILIGTTTENPSFHINSALLSRCKVVTLEILKESDLEKIILRAEKELGKKLPLTVEARQTLISLACGDARYLLNAAEEIWNLKAKSDLDVKKLQNLISKRAANFDKKGDVFYNLISAFHKSLRGSDVDASLYYLARMLVAGQDPYYILRRMARFATEDVGIADPNALLQVMAAKENYDFLGSPEGDYALSHAAIYLACAPKSNASYLAHKAAISAAEKTTQISPPKNILNAPTKLMKEQGFGEGYIYDHDAPNAFSGQEFFPEELLKNSRPKFYEPNERGFERDVKKRLEYWRELKNKLNK